MGLFLVLPVISVFALEMQGATPFLVGVVVGGYALTQAVFQIPFGKLSDKMGRKFAILVGLIIFFIGSIICATSTDIYMLMLGRFLQGAGAIGSVVTAMISDLVAEEVRAKAMAIMGGTIAMSFALAMALGPVIGAAFGIETLFYITAGLAGAAMILLFTKVPTPPKIIHKYNATSKTSDILKDKNMFQMVVINAMQKGLMTMAFVLIPIALTTSVADGGFGWEKSQLWHAYLPAMIFGLVAMGPAAVFGEKKNKSREIFLFAIVLFTIAFALMGYATSDIMFVVGVVSFFIGFNMMEPLVQSLMSKFAKVHQKGTALGVGNAVAYFATFIGGTTAGLLLDYTDRQTMGMALAITGVVWLLWTLRMSNPPKYSFLFLDSEHVDMQKLQELEHESIAEWFINETEAKVVVKYQTQKMLEDDIKAKILK